MKLTATLALMVTLGVTGVYAQQIPVYMTFSGDAGASAIDLKQPNTNTGEYNLAGNGSQGSFTFRLVKCKCSRSATVQHLLGSKPSSIFQLSPAPACFASRTAVC